MLGKLLTKSIPIKKNEELIPEVDRAEVEREKMILYFLIKNYEDVGEKIVSKVLIDDFKVEKYKKIYNKILEIINNGNNIYNTLANIENSEFQSSLSEIMFSEYEINSVQKFTEDIINNYEKNKLNFRKLEILKKIDDTSLTKEEIASLEKELNEIIIELAKMR